MTIFQTHPRDRVQVFIDGQNVYGTARSLGKKLNWRNLLTALEKETRLIRANYYTTVRAHQGNDKFWRMINFIDASGYTVETKEVRDLMDNNTGNIRTRGTMIGEMTADMVETAMNGTDHIILFSGDGELSAAIKKCKQHDARVTVISTENVAAEDIQFLADNFISLEDFPEDILMDENSEYDRPPQAANAA